MPARLPSIVLSQEDSSDYIKEKQGTVAAISAGWNEQQQRLILEIERVSGAEKGSLDRCGVGDGGDGNGDGEGVENGCAAGVRLRDAGVAWVWDVSPGVISRGIPLREFADRLAAPDTTIRSAQECV